MEIKMNKISEIISTPVISLYESELLGIIYNVIIDYRRKTCKFALILDEKDNIPRVIRFADIFKLGKDCIFVKNSACVEIQTNIDKELEDCTSIINLNAYNLDGEFIGTSIDAMVDDNYNISEIVLNNQTFVHVSNIINIGNSAILIDYNKVNISRFRPKQKIKLNVPEHVEDKVVILSNIINNKDEQQQSNKIITDFRFLVGRILNKDIVAINGELIARNGAIVTKDIINKASFYGKLVEIARYSKK